MRYLGVALFALASVSVAPVQEEDIRIDRVKLSEPAFDDIAHLLNIKKVSGEYALRGPISTVSIVLESHKKGVKQDKSMRSPTLRGEPGEGRQGRFTIQVADLEILKLGDAQGQARVYFSLNEGITSTTSHADFSKAWFDFSSIRASGTFKPKVQGKNRIPLFWRVAGPEGAVGFGDTTEAVLEKNPGMEVLIASLVLE